jgi:hypothetical protein
LSSSTGVCCSGTCHKVWERRVSRTISYDRANPRAVVGLTNRTALVLLLPADIRNRVHASWWRFQSVPSEGARVCVELRSPVARSWGNRWRGIRWLREPRMGRAATVSMRDRWPCTSELQGSLRRDAAAAGEALYNRLAGIRRVPIVGDCGCAPRRACHRRVGLSTCRLAVLLVARSCVWHR